VAGLRWPAAALARRIAERTARMFADGLTEEVSRLRVAFPHGSPAASRAIGYAEAQAVCDGLLDMPAAAALVEARTRQLARRQMTWLRHQLNVAWVDAGPADGPDTLAAAVLDVWRKHGPAPLDGL
jgi:tRNA dimethylallyltransferase